MTDTIFGFRSRSRGPCLREATCGGCTRSVRVSRPPRAPRRFGQDAIQLLTVELSWRHFHARGKRPRVFTRLTHDAIRGGEDHGIKFTDVMPAEHRLNPDPVYLAAAEAALS